MTAARTVTVQTLDHGPVTLPEPSWCAGHTDQKHGFRVDLTHVGEEHYLGPANELLLLAQFVQYPFTSAGSPDIGAYVEQVDLPSTFDPPGLDKLAAAYVEAAKQLRDLARQLAVMREASR